MFSQPFSIPSALIALLSLPLILGWIPRQSFYGARTAKTLARDEIWYPANRFTGAILLISSCIYFVIAWALPEAGTASTIGLKIWFLHLAAFVLPLLAGLFLIRFFIQTL
ncbi:MAG TPA: SdpI family protein [Anaerolineales bacterium]|nr:SdpI family protein [Anaerolineales bacterium]